MHRIPMRSTRGWGGPRLAALAPAVAALLFVASPRLALAGPPYTTDDPEPVELRHWEVYLASQDFWTGGEGLSGTLPHLEVNYGAAPDLQLHLIVPLAWARPQGEGVRFGPGDIELGAKYRFVHEGAWLPQIGTFPFVELPVGDSSRGLGAGQPQVFLPLWLQKSVGPWTSYGGAGYWINPGAGNRNWWYVGWQAQRQVVSALSVGAEVFYSTPRQVGGDAEARFNLGAVLDLSPLQHLLFSAGRAFTREAAQLYVAYQLTFGPGEGPALHPE